MARTPEEEAQWQAVREKIKERLGEDFIARNSTHEHAPPGHDCNEECGVSMEDVIAASNPYCAPMRSGGKKHKKCQDCWDEYLDKLVDAILALPEIEVRDADQRSVPGGFVKVLPEEARLEN